jgi:hypothetical protein
MQDQQVSCNQRATESHIPGVNCRDLPPIPGSGEWWRRLHHSGPGLGRESDRMRPISARERPPGGAIPARGKSPCPELWQRPLCYFRPGNGAACVPIGRDFALVARFERPCIAWQQHSVIPADKLTFSDTSGKRGATLHGGLPHHAQSPPCSKSSRASGQAAGDRPRVRPTRRRVRGHRPALDRWRRCPCTAWLRPAGG